MESRDRWLRGESCCAKAGDGNAPLFLPPSSGGAEEVWRRRQGRRHSSGEGRSCGRSPGALALFRTTPNTPQINEVAVVVRVEEFVAGLALNRPGLPGSVCMSGSPIL